MENEWCNKSWSRWLLWVCGSWSHWKIWQSTQTSLSVSISLAFSVFLGFWFGFWFLGSIFLLVVWLQYNEILGKGASKTVYGLSFMFCSDFFYACIFQIPANFGFFSAVSRFFFLFFFFFINLLDIPISDFFKIWALWVFKKTFSKWVFGGFVIDWLFFYAWSVQLQSIRWVWRHWSCLEPGQALWFPAKPWRSWEALLWNSSP